jgi:anti-sigma factor RsiW
MNCEDCRAYLDAYHDNELDAAGALSIEQHLQECRSCRSALDLMRNLHAVLRRPEMRYLATEESRAGVTALLERETKAVKAVPAKQKIIWPLIPWAMAAAFLLCAGLLWFKAQSSPSTANEGLLVAELASSHVRSLQLNHLLDVASSDQQAVKPWFAQKLQYTPPVWESNDHSFALLGGRLDYVSKQPVSALVYRYKDHLINVFVWPSKINRELEGELSASAGYNLMHWRKNGMACWAVSDASPQVMKEFYEQLEEAKT